ncbi:hypothetical protein HanRHA438_Chr11g0506521 [Helianthus annuus]|nr:hypothetical protein HanHA300_Chr11g0404901 [Helianthus annuus]KAJ0509676.1 hypothetical protein HanIR_Chr11g0531841 [Helianthus annuus]KAJ0517691.1 hypothetical protein HanHA89_Chr11g0428581 [Helianthus annuus]KAJ0685708.1 hypothetical protein HanLR1_Chr11g0406081 [Helianthus annuus]KAJ0870946.1 hypothetical protein HanRHA438_Chr11g0506521 [Helianthus annuus]
MEGQPSRVDWANQLEAIVFPLCLTFLMYIGSFILKFISIWSSWTKHRGPPDRYIISWYKEWSAKPH